MRKLKGQSGFTLIELFIVLIVIGILAFIVTTTYSGIQAKYRNSKRETDLSMIQKALEAYYNQNEYYPNLTDLNSAQWRAANLKGFHDSYLVDPRSTCNPKKDVCVTAKPTARAFSYQPVQSDGTSGCNGKLGSGADQYCAGYTLTATFEGTYNGSTTYVLHNL